MRAIGNTGTGSGSGLPTQVITYAEFKQMTEAEQSTFVGYVSDWPGEGGIWTTIVSCAVGDTTCTISNPVLSTSSIIDPYCQNASGTPVGIASIVVTAGQAVITFNEALTEATDFRINIIDPTVDYGNIWTDPVACAAGATTCTVTNLNIHTTSVIRVYSQTASGATVGVSSIVASEGSAVLTFSALSEATSFRLRVVNL